MRLGRLFFAGAERWREVAAQMEVREALVVTAAGEVVVTEAFARRLKFLNDDLKPRTVP